jgi:hypothetical protein
VIPFNLAANSDSAPITVAADNPVLIIGNSTTVGDGGVGYITVQHRAGSFLQWSGVSSPTTTNAPGAAVGGFAGNLGQAPPVNMVAIDFNAKVFLTVVDADHFVVHNTNASAVTGKLWILPAPM